MHSPNMSGPAVTMRRPEHYTCLDQGSRPGEPSSKILQSLLYNFAHSGYLNSQPGDNRTQRNDTSLTRSNSDGDSSAAESTSQTPQEYSRNRMRHHPDLSSAQRQTGYRHLPHPHTSSHVGLESTHIHPRCFQNPSSTITPQSRGRDGTAYAENYLSPRHRSSSIGSAGSSFRDSRSPSHDSTASHDSLSRCSPLSIASSPSPSPPTPDNNTSKLLGILKGASYNYPYATVPINRNSQHPESTNSSLATSHRRSSSISENSDVSTYSCNNLDQYKNLSRQKWGTNSHKLKAHSSSSYEGRKRDISQCQDEPIDLSIKPKKNRTESYHSNDSYQSLERRLSWRSDYFPSGSSEAEDVIDADSAPKKSILESILCGRSALKEKPEHHNQNGYRQHNGFDTEPVPTIQRHHDESSSFFTKTPTPVPTSPLHFAQSPLAAGSLPVSLPPSPALSVGSNHFGIGSPKPRCPWRQRVTLAKKNLFPVSARVSDWVTKIVRFAKSLPEFASLPDADKVTLTKQCWTRMMLLYMAENNFLFAVTPVHEDTDDGRPPAISGIDPTEPTMDSVELVQNFIRKCQNLCVEPEEYDCLRLVTLFHAGCHGLENTDFVDKISSNSRHALQQHVRKSHPDDKLRYSNLLLCLHTLFGVNCGMVQTLFCQHIARDRNIDEEIQDLVLKREVNGDDRALNI